jgi:hypothetical protein
VVPPLGVELLVENSQVALKFLHHAAPVLHESLIENLDLLLYLLGDTDVLG